MFVPAFWEQMWIYSTADDPVLRMIINVYVFTMRTLLARKKKKLHMGEPCDLDG